MAWGPETFPFKAPPSGDPSFPGGSAGKESTCNVGDLGSILGLGRSSGEEKGYLLQYPGVENPMDCIACGVAKSRTQLSDFHFTGVPRVRRAGTSPWGPGKMDKMKTKVLQPDLLGSNATPSFTGRGAWPPVSPL